MSLSANDSAFPRAASGKTPPPAPSAAYARRAREMAAEQTQAARYRPPALRALQSTTGVPLAESPTGSNVSGQQDIQATPLPPANYPPGFRRQRAGTLPPNVQLAAQRFAQVSDSLSALPDSADSYTDTFAQASAGLQQPSTANAGLMGSGVRPGLRHTSTSIAAAAVSERNVTARLRSGSLSVGPSAAGNSAAFGSSLFGMNLLSGGNSSFPVLEERGLGSIDSGGGDEFDVHTLDYLGLDDTLRPPPAATLSELRSQAQQAIAGNLAPRHRSATVSNPYRLRTTRLGTPGAEDVQEDILEDYDTYNQTDAYDAYNDPNAAYLGNGGLVAKGFKQSAHLQGANGLGVRPRAISVGILDDPSRASGRLSDMHQDVYGGDYGTGSLSHSGSAANLSQLTGVTRTSSYLLPSGQANARSISPKQNDIPSQHQNQQGQNQTQTQTPTRSLWIGNLDSSVTSEQLMHIFHPYGAIESLRLLPEKECGFVNFVDQADAIRAKEDVLNRLGGQIGMPNGQAVRIGFGKADSAPVAPAKGSTTTNLTIPGGNAGGSKGINSANGSGNGSVANGNNGGANGMESQLQSTPTRALWIGSIPSTTTPATILSVFSPYGPIESARVLTHKNCGFINFERLDDAVRARKALNGRDVLGSDVGAIRIGFAKVPVKNGQDNGLGADDASGINASSASIQGVGDLSVGATIHALRSIKGASTVPAEQQVLSGTVENYRSNLLLSMVASGSHIPFTGNGAGLGPIGAGAAGVVGTVTEQQMIMRELTAGAPDAEPDVAALAEFRPPTMYYTTIPLVSDRPNNRRWDASKLRELRRRLDSGTMTTQEIDGVAGDFLDSEIVDLASDWLGNTVVQKLFENCSPVPKFAMLERLAPHLAMIGIHKNGTWAAQKIIECVNTPEEIQLLVQNLRPYTPPLLLDQFGNYVVQGCLRFGAPATDFVFDAMIDRLWEIAQGRFGARSMRTCLESPNITISQQRRVATAIILNSIPLATNPNGALLLTWLLDSSGFNARYQLLAPRFTPHLSHLCTHKLASLTVLRIVNQKAEPDASKQIVEALFFSPGDHVLTDVLGDQVNGVAVVLKVLTSPYIDPMERPKYLEVTKRVLIELKVIATQAYRRLIEEVGLPVSSFQTATPGYGPNGLVPPQAGGKMRDSMATSPQMGYSVSSYTSATPSDQNLASMMASLQMGGQSHMAPTPGLPQQLQVDPLYAQAQAQYTAAGRGGAPQNLGGRGMITPSHSQSPNTDPFNPFGLQSPDMSAARRGVRNSGGMAGGMGMGVAPQSMSPPPSQMPGMAYNTQAGGLGLAQGGMMNMGMGQGQAAYGMQPQSMPPHVYQAYMYQMYQQQNGGTNGGQFPP